MTTTELSKEILAEFADKILKSSGGGEAQKAVLPFLNTLCSELDLELHPANFRDLDFTLTPYGKAVSPTTAAQCAEDLERSRVFMQATYQAVLDRLTSERPVQLLYAGTGPLGWLVLPLLSRFSPKQLQVTALDIHQASLDSFRHLCHKFSVEDRISEWICADATSWWPEPLQGYDIILSETMNQFLEQEPQIQIFVNLQRYLNPAGCLIPQLVQLSAVLEWRALQCRQQHILGSVFALDQQAASELARGRTASLTTQLPLPDFEFGPVDIRLRTEIQVYQQYWLREGESQLTLPKYRRQLLLQPGTMLGFNYASSQLPRWLLSYQCASDTLVPSENLEVEGIYHLHRLWQKTLQNKLRKNLPNDEWQLDRAVLDMIGLGLQPGIQMLFRAERLSELQQEIRQLQLTESDKSRINQQLVELATAQQPRATPSVLSEQQLAFWREHGYLLIPALLSPEQCEQSRNAIWQHLAAHPDQPATWYSCMNKSEKIMLSLFRHPVLDANREIPKLRQIFEQLWQRTDLVMSTDRVSFNPPETAGWAFPGPEMHWDMPLKAPVHFATQGLIYLTDTPEQQGAFCCVPGFHKKIEQWIQSQNKDEFALQHQNWADWPVKAIAGKAGDLIVWQQALPHGPSANTADFPRMVQYVNCYPLATGAT